ncbi:MAG: NAD-glutamate dehydrogenase domain-containing protein [Nitriliruptoraceae bacterium]
MAEAALRRAPDHLLSRPPDEVAERLVAAFDGLDRRRPGELVVELRRRDDVVGMGTAVVISEDRPFLLSSVIAELGAAGLTVRGSFHPIVGVERSEDGRITAITPARPAHARASIIHVEVAGLPPEDDGDPVLLDRLRACVTDVRAVTDDHEPMREQVRRAATALGDHIERGQGDDRDAEVAALLTWILEDNLVLLGVQTEPPSPRSERATPGCGLLREEDRRRHLLAGVPIARADEDLPRLAVSRSRVRATVQRRALIEIVTVTLPEDGARVVILGLLTRKGVAEPIRDTPVLRRRLEQVFESEDIVEGSHDAITLTTIAQAIPKDELLRADTTTARDLLLGLLQAEEHREVFAIARPHAPSRTISVLVSVPQERWRPGLERRIGSLLRARFGADTVETDAAVDLRYGTLARLVLTLPGEEDPAARVTDRNGAGTDLTEAIADLARPWEDAVVRELTARSGPAVAEAIGRTIVNRLPTSYRDVTDPDEAVADVILFDEVVRGDESLLVALRRADQGRGMAPGDRHHGDRSHLAPFRLLVAKRGPTLELSAFLPILESLGLTTVDEVPHPLVYGEGPDATLHDFGVRTTGLDPTVDGPRLAEAILAAWRGHLEVDPLNQLVVVAGLGWHDLQILRAYRRLRRQLGTAYTPAYVDTILVDHPVTVRSLVEHIHARFDPRRAADAPDEEATRAEVLAALDRLERLDHDRILRRILDLIDATLRTNAFRPDARADGSGEAYVAIKFDPNRIADAPQPRPYREIFVHSPRVEGVHLRSGPVSRGGLRWSDRRDDVRTEVLDLLKAQVLKNAVIVPSGAKGGFVVTREPADPAELPAEAERQYITFIRGLLDVTDDLDGDEVVPPPDVVRHDGDDPYLVVAADRGTATFSDTANAVARRYGFWLDDAFASGGSHGYDHKRFGVTAKGAWVAVARHFRELGMDVATEPVSIAGIGDMSGDVFGNGLLRSRAVRLVAAFDHRHIFLDPDPDPEASYQERARLYALPRSGWDDYDRSVLSPDGMIVSRTAKSVALTERIRELLRTDAVELTPPELIRAVLCAPVDLLFAGGIGTYVRATDERDQDIGDRANDDVRVEASRVRARVYGEGANLSITQRARIELARRGTLLNQDAVDNAAGVATSDLEVNLKILLRAAEDRGELTRKARNQLLEELAEDVVEAAVRVVEHGTVAISRELDRSSRSLATYDALLTRLEREEDLDRVAEALPSTAEFAARADAGAGMTRPELATLVAWSKRDLKDALLASRVPDSALCRPALARSLPPRAVERFPELLAAHRLRRELITTVVTNEIVDRLGVTIVSRLADEAGVPLATVVETIQATRHIVDADRWWAMLDELATEQEPARLRELELPLEELVTTLTRVLLTDPTAPPPEATADHQHAIATELLRSLDRLGSSAQRRARTAHARWLVDDLVEPELARFLAGARDLALVPDVASVRGNLPSDPGDQPVADALLRLSERLGIDRLEDALRRAEGGGEWARRQRLGLGMDLRRARRAAAVSALTRTPVGTATDIVGTTGSEAAVERFLEGRREPLERAWETITAAESADVAGLEALGVAARTVRETIERRPRVR